MSNAHAAPSDQPCVAANAGRKNRCAARTSSRPRWRIAQTSGGRARPRGSHEKMRAIAVRLVGRCEGNLTTVGSVGTKPLAGRVAIVTGGTRGLGLEIARAYADRRRRACIATGSRRRRRHRPRGVRGARRAGRAGDGAGQQRRRARSGRPRRRRNDWDRVGGDDPGQPVRHHPDVPRRFLPHMRGRQSTARSSTCPAAAQPHPSAKISSYAASKTALWSGSPKHSRRKRRAPAST